MAVFESSRTFFVTLKDLEPVTRDVSNHFRNQGYDVHCDRRMSGAWDVGITKSNIFKSVLGLRTALKIEIVPQDNGVFAKAGIGIFGQQAIPAIITLFIFWPVLVTQIWGLVMQSKLDDEALRVIGDSLNRHSQQFVHGSDSTKGAPLVVWFCTTCGGGLPVGSSFCPSCGTRTS